MIKFFQVCNLTSYFLPVTYLSVKEAAQIAGKNERTIRRWIKANRIKTSQIRGRFHVDSDSLREYVISKKEKVKSNKKITNKQNLEKLNKTKENWEKNNEINNLRIQNKNNFKQKDIKMSGEGEDNRLENVRTVDLVGEKMREYVRLLENQNQILNLEKLNKTKENLIELGKTGKNWEKQNPTNHNQGSLEQTKVIKEGEEYVLDRNVRTKNMSEKGEINMSVKKYLNYPIVSQDTDYDAVEMSEDSDSKMSVRQKSALDKYITDMSPTDMSVFDGHLSTILDTPVDKFFDGHGKLVSESPFFGGEKKMSGHLFGHLNRTKKMSDFLDKMSALESPKKLTGDSQINPVSISAYATRLIEEKERVAHKFERDNVFLKNELTALRKELTAMREVVGRENKNQATMTEFLMNTIKTFQTSTNIPNFPNTYIREETEQEERSKKQDVGQRKKTIDQELPLVEGRDVILHNNGMNNHKKITDITCPEIYKRQEMFLLGMGLGMIFGFLCVSLVLVLLIYTGS